MTTSEAFLHALNHESIKSKYAASSIRTWRSRAIREKLSLDFMIEFLSENGYQVKQAMEWNVTTGANIIATNHTSTTKETSDPAHGKDYKAQLTKKLYAIRKQLSAELYTKWYEWSKAEYSRDFPNKKIALTPVVFSQMTYGRYISKENVPFALKILKEGKTILHDYQEFIKREVDSI